jgi:acetylornithine deacetylase/succinyl-diaminopimelate desuccinylase-like protein
MRPTATVLAVDGPRVQEASNTLLPSARAKVSMRLAPGQDPDRALDVLEGWLRERAPWGVEVALHRGMHAAPFVVDPGGPVFAAAERALSSAFGAPVAYMGVGGTIPLLEPLQRRLGNPTVLLTAAADPDSRAHGIDESLELGDWRRACLAEAHLFSELAALGAEGVRT